MPSFCSIFAVHFFYLKLAMAYYTWIGVISTSSHGIVSSVFL
jgi:hypothetical protein